MKIIGEHIKKTRKIKKMTLKDVAEKSGLSVSLLSQIERDKALPSITTLRTLAQCLDVSMV